MFVDIHRTDQKFGVIYADPPWAFKVRSDKGMDRSAEQHYSTMSLADIKALPVERVAAPDCALLMWVTDPFLEQGLEVMNAWGFTFKTVGFLWAKLRRKAGEDALASDASSYHVGMGYYTRANPEICLLGTRGRPQRLHKDVRRLIVAPVREHSRKPDETHDRVERLFPGPYLELFARQTRPGWSVWGNETSKF